MTEKTDHNREKATPKVAIMYLVWDQEPFEYLQDVIDGVKNQDYPRDDLEFLIVYNHYKEGNTSACPYIREQIEKHTADLPHTTILEQSSNLGFSGGNNHGMQWAIDHGYDYVFLHNADAYMGKNCISKLVDAMEADKTIGAAQSLVMLHPETSLINTSGNVLHYLMVGYCDDYKHDISDVHLPKIKDVGYLSGAAAMMRTDLLKEHGLWDEDYFMYHEDTDYSLRLQMLGYRTVMVRYSDFFHKYQFKKSIGKYFWIERNRYVLILLYYRWPTILLLIPMLFVFEIGLIIFSLRGGWFDKRLEVYKYFSKKENWTSWLKKRKAIQASRKISDRKVLAQCSTGVHFQEDEMRNPLLLYVGNPLMAIYYFIVVRLLIWW
ncbi:glycosyltransferase family 2 protein [Candidatus Nomurabacteria bacterium]|nr:glycosyltransferase family 2 protein [Candidatus Nomurabacteria bacterium]